MPREIFVFGSNLAGIHGGGAAADAVEFHGAIWGVGEGIQGDSYAVPTKDREIHTRSLAEIAVSVATFLAFARANPELRFLVTRIGCGLAGYKDLDIAPMFAGAPENCALPIGWRTLATAKVPGGADPARQAKAAS